MGLSPKSSILMGLSIVNHAFWANPIGNLHIKPVKSMAKVPLGEGQKNPGQNLAKDSGSWGSC